MVAITKRLPQSVDMRILGIEIFKTKSVRSGTDSAECEKREGPGDTLSK